MFSPSLEVVHNNLPEPTAIVVMVGDILVNGQVVDGFRQIKMRLPNSPTQEEIMKTGAQLQAEIWPLLWQNFTC